MLSLVQMKTNPRAWRGPNQARSFEMQMNIELSFNNLEGNIFDRMVEKGEIVEGYLDCEVLKAGTMCMVLSGFLLGEEVEFKIVYKSGRYDTERSKDVFYWEKGTKVRLMFLAEARKIEYHLTGVNRPRVFPGNESRFNLVEIYRSKGDQEIYPNFLDSYGGADAGRTVEKYRKDEPRMEVSEILGIFDSPKARIKIK